MNRLIKFIKNDIFRIASSLTFFISALILEQFEFELFSLVLYLIALFACGFKVFLDAVKGILRRDLLDEKFLMSLASIGAMIVGEWSEGVAVMIFYLIGETFESCAVRRSRKSIKSLMDICPDEASVLNDGVEERVDAEGVPPGATIIVRPGERVPVDCVILSGASDVDTSSMTGESLPVSMAVGDELSSGFVVINGMLICQTLRVATESAAARVLSLVEEASENKSEEEKFITKFSHYYTPTVVICAVIFAVLPAVFGTMSFFDSLYRALIFLVISCPCALVISVPMAFFGGIGGAASRGILFKGGNIFGKIAKSDTIAFDKTGTVTNGEFAILRVETFGVSEKELLRLSASCEFASNHPIAECIRKSCPDAQKPEFAEEIIGEGIVAIFEGHTVAVGNKALMKRQGVNIGEIEGNPVFVSKDDSLIGLIYISDEIKTEAKETVNKLLRLGVSRVAMISGDKREKVSFVCREIGIVNYYSEQTPEEKYRKLETLIEESRFGTIYVGDGINDAPSLARADIGIAMGAMGQDSAIEVADVVIVSDNLERIPEAILLARKTIKISRQNIVFALGIKFAIVALGALGIANMWLAVFADVGVAVIAILNSMRTLSVPRS